MNNTTRYTYEPRNYSSRQLYEFGQANQLQNGVLIDMACNDNTTECKKTATVIGCTIIGGGIGSIGGPIGTIGGGFIGMSVGVIKVLVDEIKQKYEELKLIRQQQRNNSNQNQI